MKTCKECGIEYDDYKKFCKKCGSALTEKKKIETMETVKKLVFEERLKADPLNLEILKEFSLSTKPPKYLLAEFPMQKPMLQPVF